MKIIVTYNLENKKRGFVSADYDTSETIENIKKAIEKKGHKVYLVEADENAYEKFKKLKEKGEVDLVFNYSLGLRGPCRQAHIPAMLEMLDIPYCGSDAATITLCQNKAHTKEILISYGIKTANFQMFYNPNEKIRDDLRYPLIIKCVHEDSSIGLGGGGGVVTNKDELKKRIKFINEKFKQPALVEEYIDGREFTLGALGNLPDLQFLPLLEIIPNDKNKKLWIWDKGPKFIGSDLKKIDELKNQYNLFYVCPAQNISLQVYKKMEDVVKQVFYKFPAKDHIRVDFRVKNETPYVLEVNNCSHLASNGSIVCAAKAAGLSFSDLINKIIESAKNRYNIR